MSSCMFRLYVSCLGSVSTKIVHAMDSSSLVLCYFKIFKRLFLECLVLVVACLLLAFIVCYKPHAIPSMYGKLTTTALQPFLTILLALSSLHLGLTNNFFSLLLCQCCVLSMFISKNIEIYF